MSTTERTTVRLPKGLLRQARAKANRDKRTLTSLIEEGVRSILRPERNETAKSVAKLPISKHRGGLQQGVDLTDISSIYEQEDLERARRSIEGAP